MNSFFIFCISIYEKKKEIFIYFFHSKKQHCFIDILDLFFLLCEKKFLIWYIVNMPVYVKQGRFIRFLVNMFVAPIAQNKTKISFFLCPNSMP